MSNCDGYVIYPVADPAPDDADQRRAALYGGLLEGRAADDTADTVYSDWDRFTPSLQDALAMLDAYAWHPLYDAATDAVEGAAEAYGIREAMARATELERLFETMCSVSPWGWLG